MSELIESTHLLVIPRLRVQNANAISSPLTHGFPAMTAFLGLMWALERKLQQQGLDIPLNAVGVVCHDHQELVTDSGFVKSFRLTRNPVDKAGKTAAIVEEGRIHLDISLVFGINTDHWQQDYPTRVANVLSSMRIAGGSVIPPSNPALHRYRPWVVDMAGTEADRANHFRTLARKLLPGFALVSRDDLIGQRLQELQKENPQANRLDAWLSLSRINWRYEREEGSDKGGWQHDRAGLGWVVPIPVGYGALSELHEAGSVANARDAHTPFRFVESLYSVGAWIPPHRLTSPDQLLWYADSQPEHGLYRCRNNFASSTN